MPCRSMSAPLCWAPARCAASAAAPPAASASVCRRLRSRGPCFDRRNVTGARSSLASAGLGGLRLIPPPDRREGVAPIFGHDLGMAEAIPAGGALLPIGPLRHHIVVPQQHAVECPRGGDEIGAILGEDDPV